MGTDPSNCHFLSAQGFSGYKFDEIEMYRHVPISLWDFKFSGTSLFLVRLFKVSSGNHLHGTTKGISFEFRNSDTHEFVICIIEVRALLLHKYSNYKHHLRMTPIAFRNYLRWLSFAMSISLSTQSFSRRYLLTFNPRRNIMGAANLL